MWILGLVRICKKQRSFFFKQKRLGIGLWKPTLVQRTLSLSTSLGAPGTPRTSQLYGTEGFKGGLNWAPIKPKYIFPV